MESKKINQLATELTPALSDLTIIGDPTTGISKKITLSQMASLFTGTVEEYANLAAFPLVGVADTIYIALDTNIIYRYDTSLSAYVILSPNIINSLVFSDANGFDGTITLVGSVATLSITTALTLGSVPFIGASGALLQDNANFFWDDTNNRLGLGTNAPTTALDVFGSGIIGRVNGTSTNNAFLGFASAGSNKWSIGNVQSDHRFRIYSEANTSELVSVLQTGEFGIGIANPTTKLHIDGGASALIANLDANVSVAKSISFRSDNSNRINLEVSGTESGSDAGADLFIRRYSDAGALLDTPFFIKRSSGNIGISTTSPNIGGYGTNSRVLTIQGVSGSYGILELTSNSANADGNAIGRLDFGSDGQAANYKAISSIASFLSGSTSTKFGADLRFYTRANNAASGDPSERMRITRDGLVGINTSNPTGRLMLYQNTAGNVFQNIVSAVGGSTQVGINLSPSMTDNEVAANPAQASIYATDSNYGANIIFANKTIGAVGNSLTERMRITSAGFVGIDTDTAAAKLSIGRTANTESNIFLSRQTNSADVNIGCIRAALGPFWYDATSTSLAEINLQTDTTAYFKGAIMFSTNNSDATANRASLRMYINAAGSIGTTKNGTNIYNASDVRLKENIVTIENGLDKILKLNPVKFNWVEGFAEDGKDMLGFIAQEVKNIIPEAIEDFGGEDNIVEIGDLKVPNPLRINEKFIIPVLVKAIQELKAEIDLLKAK